MAKTESTNVYRFTLATVYGMTGTIKTEREWYTEACYSGEAIDLAYKEIARRGNNEMILWEKSGPAHQ